MEANQPQVRDNTAQHRFEVEVDGETAIAEYVLSDGQIVFTHTVVPPSLRGGGVGSTLVRGALDQARQRELAVVPLCQFVSAYLQRHPEYQDLIASS